MRQVTLLLAAALGCAAQDASIRADAFIRVDASARAGSYKPIYGWFGYDEPNFTYTANGRKLIGELAALSGSPVYIRTHFMLATGDGTPGLKFGSTNAYTEDAAGKPVYDWTITDRILDTYLQAGARPFIEVGFMPKALSTKPEPYSATWTPGAPNREYYAGWAYPPKDFDKWGELVYQWVRHAVAKYGAAEVANWYWEVWNEPDIGYWHGTPEEYDRLYDASALAVKRALPAARVGGPASTGPAGEKSAAFLRQFLAHCDQTGVPLDFITYHAKGRAVLADGHVRMGVAKNAQDVDKGYRIVASFPKFKNLPIILSESDPEGCAACSARVYPQNAYRNGTLYPAYTAVMMKNIFELADRGGTNIAGMLSWAFEFEGQPWFDGLRTLATNGVDKPVLNVFRMAGLMHGDRLGVESPGRIPLDSILRDGVRDLPDIDALATRSGDEISVMAWNYHDDDLPASPATVRIEVRNPPAGTLLLTEYRIDDTHSNSWTAWKKMGSPRNPTPAQLTELEAAGQLQLFGSPRYVEARGGVVTLNADLPRNSVSLFQLRPAR